jgi:hypothetical protein
MVRIDLQNGTNHHRSPRLPIDYAQSETASTKSLHIEPVTKPVVKRVLVHAAPL